MSNRIVDFRKMSNTNDVPVIKLKPSTEVYTDISLDSKYVVGNQNESLKMDKLREEIFDDNLILTERHRDEMNIITDESQDRVKYIYDANGFKVSKSINVKAVQNAIENIFNFIPGERVLYPEFGSRIRYYLYEGITPDNVEQVVAEINASFLKFDPRVIVDDIKDMSDILDHDDNTVVLRITYHIKNLPLEYYQYDYSYIRPID